jgi:hypothetical protein
MTPVSGGFRRFLALAKREENCRISRIFANGSVWWGRQEFLPYQANPLPNVETRRRLCDYYGKDGRGFAVLDENPMLPEWTQ